MDFRTELKIPSAGAEDKPVSVFHKDLRTAQKWANKILEGKPAGTRVVCYRIQEQFEFERVNQAVSGTSYTVLAERTVNAETKTAGQ